MKYSKRLWGLLPLEIVCLMAALLGTLSFVQKPAPVGIDEAGYERIQIGMKLAELRALFPLSSIDWKKEATGHGVKQLQEPSDETLAEWAKWQRWELTRKSTLPLHNRDFIQIDLYDDIVTRKALGIDQLRLLERVHPPRPRFNIIAHRMSWTCKKCGDNFRSAKVASCAAFHGCPKCGAQIAAQED